MLSNHGIPDAHANRKSFPRRNIFRSHKCLYHNYEDRGCSIIMAGYDQCYSRRRYGQGNVEIFSGRLKLGIGPAHAVYFATYEAVKQAMGGNERSTHHPLAAGEFYGSCNKWLG